MAFGNSMMKWRIAFIVGCIQRALVLKKEGNHGRRANSSSTVDRILPTAVANARRSFVVDKKASNIEVLFGRYKMEGRLLPECFS